MNKWMETFKNAGTQDVIMGRLRVPKSRSVDNVILVTEAVKQLKERLNKGYDQFYMYIDDGRQYREAQAYNNEIDTACHMLTEKLEIWLEGK